MSDKPIDTVNTGGNSTRGIYNEDTRPKQKVKKPAPSKPNKKPATKK